MSRKVGEDLAKKSYPHIKTDNGKHQRVVCSQDVSQKTNKQSVMYTGHKFDDIKVPRFITAVSGV